MRSNLLHWRDIAGDSLAKISADWTPENPANPIG
jgi:hypothetical protein